MRAVHVSVRVAPVRGALSHGDLLKFFIIIIIIITIIIIIIIISIIIIIIIIIIIVIRWKEEREVLKIKCGKRLTHAFTYALCLSNHGTRASNSIRDREDNINGEQQH